MIDPDHTIAEEVWRFYALQGRAMSRWTVVELNVLNIYMIALGNANSDAATAAYHIPTGFRTHLAMATSALEVRLYVSSETAASLLGRWAKLRERTGNRASERNNLVHWITFPSPSNPVGKRVYLTQNSSNSAVLPRITGKPRKCIHASDLMAIDRRFQILGNDLCDFADDFSTYLIGEKQQQASA